MAFTPIKVCVVLQLSLAIHGKQGIASVRVKGIRGPFRFSCPRSLFRSKREQDTEPTPGRGRSSTSTKYGPNSCKTASYKRSWRLRSKTPGHPRPFLTEVSEEQGSARSPPSQRPEDLSNQGRPTEAPVSLSAGWQAR